MRPAKTVGPRDCFACDVNAGRQTAPGGRVYEEDDYWVADHGFSRLVRGYLVLKPRRHVHELTDLIPEEAATLGVGRSVGRGGR